VAIVAADCDCAALGGHGNAGGAVFCAEAAELGARGGGEDVDAARGCDEDCAAAEVGDTCWLAGGFLCGAGHGGGGGVDGAESVVPADRVHVGGA